MKWKITQDITAPNHESYALMPVDAASDDRVLLVFEAQTYEEAVFIKNQFLHFEPYLPFDQFWIAEAGHWITIAGKVKSRLNYERRSLIVLAKNETEAREKMEAEAQAYAKPYQNQYDEEVIWAFDQLYFVRPMDFFNTIELYQGKVIEINSSIHSKKVNQLSKAR
jgi:hypothetical protein